MSKLVNALCEVFDVTQHHTSAYHPNTNGMVERQNSTLAQCLRSYCSKEQGKWPELLPSIMMAFRKSPAMQSTEFSPFHLVFGEEMRLPFDTSLEPVDRLSEDAKCFVKHLMHKLKVAHDIARENHLAHQQKNKERHDASVRHPDFKIGDKVMFKVTKTPKGMSSKLHDKADRPFRIIQIGPNYTYKLVRCDNNKVHPSFINATNLKAYHDPNVLRTNIGTNSNDESQSDQQQVQSDQSRPSNRIVRQQSSQDQSNNSAARAPVDHCSQNGTSHRNDADKKWVFKRFLRGRFKHGKREIRVEWESNERTWEPDESFDDDVLEKINRIFTKRGKFKGMPCKLLLTMALFMVMTTVQTAPVETEKTMVNRLNYGVIFKPDSNIILVQQN
ncbi:hypothetical protein FSP39_023446 [Pinctada imbricata]|uniref:Integrase catalytic domain-containing protein n=1 Tax=Pinctada imbricata TaxID=66713 RepID=A0AA88YKV1_PINIB|nr:hypothetical protein FSP39_023446 [Pinctada imbricata]